MKKPSLRAILRAINNYVVFFLIVAFAVTCCMLLFVNVLADTISTRLAGKPGQTRGGMQSGSWALGRHYLETTIRH